MKITIEVIEALIRRLPVWPVKGTATMSLKPDEVKALYMILAEAHARRQEGK